MDRFTGWIRNFISELHRRRVIRVAVVYAGIAFVILQLGEILAEPFGLADWVLQMTTLLLVLGFPLALSLAWVYNITEEGIVRDKGVRLSGSSPPEGESSGDDSSEKVLGEETLKEESAEVVVGRATLLSSAVIIVLLAAGLGGAWWFSEALTGAEAGGEEFSEHEKPPTEKLDGGSVDLEPSNVAVLYFDDNSPGDTLTAFADGFTEHLIHRLAQVEDLEVESRHAVKPYRDGPPPLDSIARHLGAGSLVEGSVRGRGEDLVVTVQLIDGETQSHLMSEVVRRPAEEIFSLQESIAREVSELLRVRLGRQVQLESWQAETDHPKAWRLVQRSNRLREDAEQLNREGDRRTAAALLSQADSLLSEAESIDPDWSKPDVLRARLAETRLPPSYGQVQWNERQRRVLREGIRHAEEALDRDSSDAEARRVRGRLRFWLSQQVGDSERAQNLVDRAEEDLRVAVREDPGSARAWYALSELMQVGRADFKQARYYAERAQKADAYLRLPADYQYQFFYAAINAENFEDAARWCQYGQNRYPDKVQFRNCELALMATEGAAEPDVGRAWELLEEIQARVNAENRDRFEAYTLPKIASILVRAGRPDSARAVLDRARRENVTPEKDPFVAYQQAYTHLLLGNEEQTLDLLSSFLERAPHYAEMVANDIWFEPLQERPRFKEIVSR